MTDTPPDWVLIEAAKRCGWDMDAAFLRKLVNNDSDEVFRALCDMIQKYEQPPVDRKVLCARKAMAGQVYDGYTAMAAWKNKAKAEEAAVRAIELWEGGFGND